MAQQCQVVQVDTIDGWAERRSLTGLDLLWLTVQGSEFDVLLGASAALDSVKAVYVELLASHMYTNQSSVDKVHELLHAAGFRQLHDYVHSKNGKPVHVSLLFVRKPSRPPRPLRWCTDGQCRAEPAEPSTTEPEAIDGGADDE